MIRVVLFLWGALWFGIASYAVITELLGWSPEPWVPSNTLESRLTSQPTDMQVPRVVK